MKHFLNIMLFQLIAMSLFAQSGPKPCVVFTTMDGTNQKFWRMQSVLPATYESITDALNTKAVTVGMDKGPISVSQNGEWFIFRSTRFDAASAANGEAITIAKYDMSIVETPMNPNPNWYYGEGLAQISDDGNTFIYVDAGTTHARDIFKVERATPTAWSPPVNLTAMSPYNYNTTPIFTQDGTNRITFNGSDDPYIGAHIGLTDLSGNVSFLAHASDISSCNLINSATLLTDGSLIFEGETDAERVWLRDAGGNYSPVSATYTNDNSPIVAYTKIFSVHIPNSTHHIKVMGINGSGSYMLTESNSLFDEVLDIGIGAGTYMPTSMLAIDEKVSLPFSIYPNPNQGIFTIQTDTAPIAGMDLEIYDVYGKTVFSHSYLGQSSIEVKSSLSSGVYVVKIKKGNAMGIQKIIIP